MKKQKKQLLRLCCEGLLIGFLVTGCDLIKMKSDHPDHSNRIPVARVNDAYLYQDELSGIAVSGGSKEDSISRIESYINSWARKQLLIQEAMKKIDINEAVLERKILDYRYSLIAYEYQTYYVKQHLDTAIVDSTVQQYYDDHVDNFVLKQNIVRATFIKVPKNAPRTNKLREMILSDKEKDSIDLKTYCLSFSAAYHMADSTWIPIDELVRNSPFAEISNKVQALKEKSYFETTDDSYLYFLRIVEYRIRDNNSPVEFVQNEIRNIILNKRKVELAKQLENEAYDKALKDGSIEMFE